MAHPVTCDCVACITRRQRQTITRLEASLATANAELADWALRASLNSAELRASRSREEALRGALRDVGRFVYAGIHRGPAITGWQEAVNAMERALAVTEGGGG
jgi:hypothetical protein